jgi:hypothetical protein
MQFRLVSNKIRLVSLILHQFLPHIFHYSWFLLVSSGLHQFLPHTQFLHQFLAHTCHTHNYIIITKIFYC